MGIIFKQSLKNTVIIYLGFLIGGINTIFLYARFLKEDYYGLVTFVLSSSNLIMPLIVLGTHNTIIKYFTSYSTKEEKDKFLSSIMFLPLIIALIIGYFWDIFHHSILSATINDNRIIENYTIYIYIVAVSCAYFEMFYSWAKVQLQSVFGNLLKELYNRAAVMILLFAVYFDLLSKENFIVYLSYAYILRVILMMLHAFKLYRPKIRLSLPHNYKEVLKYSAYILLAGSASAIVFDIDKVMIPGKEGFAKAAYYSVAVFIGSFIEAPSRAMTQIIQPLTSKSINDNNGKELLSLYKKSSINLLVIGGLFFVLVNTNVTDLFKVMPEKGYAGGELVVLMISLAKLLNMSLGNNTAIINNSKFYKIALPVSFGMAFTVFYLNNYFYYDLNFGTDGLALATFLVVSFFGLFKLWFVNIKLKMFPFTKKTFNAFLVITCFYILFKNINFNFLEIYVYKINLAPILNIIGKSILIIILYTFVVLKLKISIQLNDLKNRFIKF